MNSILNSKITIKNNGERKLHLKASEEYISVEFTYKDYIWKGWIPLEYRRTGISISKTNDTELIEYLNFVYEELNPENFESWIKDQNIFWNETKPKALATKQFFDCLLKGGWQCVNCTLPKNPNWARRIQDIKECGYTLSTDTKRYCPNCNLKKTHLILVPLKRGILEGNGYETLSPKLRKRIIEVLKNIDVYENKNSQHLLPDHKFSEIRWDENTKSANLDNMTDEEIKLKFQLLSNQRNQQKREVCRICYQTGKRGTIFGINYFYKGNEYWDKNIPKVGKESEKGCIGCPWYDIEEWRKYVIKKLASDL